jgi:hypothetical protein
MHSIFYLEQIKQYQAPSTEDLEKFIRVFINEHSWYTHFSDERDGTFFFYLLPPPDTKDNKAIICYFWSNGLSKSWDENYTNEQERDEAMLDNLITEYSISKEILQIGKIKLSRFIHGSFSNAADYFIESPEKKSYAELHQEIALDLKKHLNNLIRKVMDKL